MLLLAGCIALPAALSMADSDKPYTLQDLQALDQRKAWNELIPHLMDVPPSQRSKEWDTLAEHACIQPGQIDPDLAQACLHPLQGVLAAQPDNKDFAWKAGKWARVNLASWTAVPFFAKAVSGPKDARCRDKDIRLALDSAKDQVPASNPELADQIKALQSACAIQ